QAGHLSQVGPLAAEKVLHVGASLSLAAREEVDGLPCRHVQAPIPLGAQAAWQAAPLSGLPAQAPAFRRRVPKGFGSPAYKPLLGFAVLDRPSCHPRPFLPGIGTFRLLPGTRMIPHHG